MKPSFIGEPLSISYKLALRACKDHQVTYDEATTETLGEKAERLAYSLAKHLECEAFLAPRGSAMDCCLKADLILKVGSEAVIWQVKTYQEAVDEHFQKEAVYQGKRFPLPGVILLNLKAKSSQKTILSAVQELSKLSGIPLNKVAIKAIELHKSSKVREIPLGVVPAIDKIYSPKICREIVTLGLGKLVEGKTLKLFP